MMCEMCRSRRLATEGNYVRCNNCAHLMTVEQAQRTAAYALANPGWLGDGRETKFPKPKKSKIDKVAAFGSFQGA